MLYTYGYSLEEAYKRNHRLFKGKFDKENLWLSLCLNGLTAMTHPCRGCDPGSTPGWGVFL